MNESTLQRILLVDDEPDILTIAKMALESFGKFVVKTCNSGAEALEEAVTFSPDLILLDVMMPDLDGPSTLVKLRELPGVAGTPVILLTAKVLNHEIAQYKELGVLDIVPKPFDPLTIANTVRGIWGEHSEFISSQKEFFRKLDELRNDFLATLPNTVTRMEELWRGYCQDGEKETLKKLHYIAHKLNGAGGTLGFQSISRDANQLELLFHQLLHNGALGCHQNEELQAIIERFRESFLPALV